jgi:hypothetical protein
VADPGFSIRLPYPHRRNDCVACRERDADGELRDGLDRPSRLCRTCLGNHIAWALVAYDKPVTIYPLADDQRFDPLPGGDR